MPFLVNTLLLIFQNTQRTFLTIAVQSTNLQAHYNGNYSNRLVKKLDVLEFARKPDYFKFFYEIVPTE